MYNYFADEKRKKDEEDKLENERKSYKIREKRHSNKLN